MRRPDFRVSANLLKYYAAFAMLIDHIGWFFVDTQSVLGYIMHIIGRTCAPIMCFFIAEGFYHTRSVKKYLLRMGIFALISWVPYVFYQTGNIKPGWHYFLNNSVFYSLFLGLLALAVIKWDKVNTFGKAVLIIYLLLLSNFGDWPFFVFGWIIIFYCFRGNFKKQAAVFIIYSVALLLIFRFILNAFMDWFQFAVILSLIPLYFYNGRRGGENSSRAVRTINKWFFYVFYPLHMIIIVIARLIIK